MLAGLVELQIFFIMSSGYEFTLLEIIASTKTAEILSTPFCIQQYHGSAHNTIFLIQNKEEFSLNLGTKKNNNMECTKFHP